MFKELVDFPGYFADESGSIYSAKRGRWLTLKPQVKKSGYAQVTLHFNQIMFFRSVHRLVAEAFFGRSEMQVNHINGDRTDNRLVNLEFCTSSQNVRHSWALGKRVPGPTAFTSNKSAGVNNPKATLSEKDAITILSMKGVKSTGEIAEQFGVPTKVIYRLWTRETWKHLDQMPCFQLTD